MKREEKNALSTQRILDAARKEFAQKGYEAASLNSICTENGLSKGIVYHYFKDKDEIYLLCVAECFDAMTAWLGERFEALSGTIEERLLGYFEARKNFFTKNPQYLGIFADAVLNPPQSLYSGIEACRARFDEQNISFLSDLMSGEKLRDGLSIPAIIEDFKVYMDYFNMSFQKTMKNGASARDVLLEHDERMHRLIDILLHGILES